MPLLMLLLAVVFGPCLLSAALFVGFFSDYGDVLDGGRDTASATSLSSAILAIKFFSDWTLVSAIGLFTASAAFCSWRRRPSVLGDLLFLASAAFYSWWPVYSVCGRYTSSVAGIFRRRPSVLGFCSRRTCDRTFRFFQRTLPRLELLSSMMVQTSDGRDTASAVFCSRQPLLRRRPLFGVGGLSTASAASFLYCL